MRSYIVKHGFLEDKYWVMQIGLFVFTFRVIKCNQYQLTGLKYTLTAPLFSREKMIEICRSPRDIYGSLVCFTNCHPLISWALISTLVLILGCLLYFFFFIFEWPFLDRSVLLIFHYPREKNGRLNSGSRGAASETVQSVPKQLCC